MGETLTIRRWFAGRRLWRLLLHSHSRGISHREDSGKSKGNRVQLRNETTVTSELHFSETTICFDITNADLFSGSVCTVC